MSIQQHHTSSIPPRNLRRYERLPNQLVFALTPLKMLSRTALRPFNQAARRGFHSTRAQLASPYHYPEGPRSNIPFNPMTRFFAVRYWGFMGTDKTMEKSSVERRMQANTAS